MATKEAAPGEVAFRNQTKAIGTKMALLTSKLRHVSANQLSVKSLGETDIMIPG